MWHVEDVAPTRAVPRAGAPSPLVSRPTAVEAVPVLQADGTTGTVGNVLDDTFTDAFAVVQDGALVSERYASAGGPATPHAVLSVSKSLVGCVAGVLLDRGVLVEETSVAEVLPELAGSGYATATVRHLLDMRSGVGFREDYDDPTSDIRRLDYWLADDRGLHGFLATLDQERPHGGPFHYRSSETDVLGWICERASGATMDALIGELLWEPMGAEHDALIMTDRRGDVVHDGGFAVTARDLLRFGQLLLAGGVVVDLAGAFTRGVLPARWMRQAWAVDADLRGAFAASPAEHAFPGGWYRNQCWFRVGSFGDVLLCLGIHGQLVYVGRRTRTVCVKLSSWPTAQHPPSLVNTLRACDALSGVLTGQDATEDVHRLSGVVSGLSRNGVRRSGPHVV